MTVKELKETLAALGVTEEDYKDLKKAELEALVAEKNNGELPPEKSATKDEGLIEIISKRKDEPCYWLANGDKLPYEDVKEFKRREVDFCPPHKAKDYAVKTKDGWILKFRHEVEA